MMTHEEETEAVNEALRLSDGLVTAVLSGDPALMRKALEVARALNSLKRSGIIKVDKK